ncbi:hypothetical protein KL930_002621 [Ogataea haglerorum]|uniref:non-specific serine/threonine protein kinase n=1 Tax=Ogataea haglerorum TaxID=1937702 RepID=A0ABQ7RJ63_9ASCO|nr:hypothetical protein KL915_002191 [Ogataea haglerorum]KAG7707600.1 hypothetical protein KL914_002421 [Ogataea haglerorum]KAG7709636.1 hypothetical protein KL950_001855 [Ogataea haglerorum]KAG7719714.1 hypothetical protein KL913_001683 [Ogataea haglerorum]KAG7721561.1 hypothetical protein KL949_001293 [Ogataea haglerorum]
MTAGAPPSVYKPGTALTVGSHKVVIEKYLSQGGFAHVYTCRISPAWQDHKIACLKRVAVPDKPTLNVLRQEVDAMRRLQGKSCIVSYIDSHASRMANGVGYEVFLLMEYCSGNGLIDFMNTRLVNKLKEPEILQIMGEITEGVAHMHALNPPLIHKDIKIENVLLSADRHYKLCDFGSASPPLRPPRNVEEFEILQNDIMKHTTPQYRCPEMIDLYKGQPIDEKSDIWALGVFLYKLCYYTTPFEQNSINGNGNRGGGEYAILHGLYSFPPTPPYSARLKNVIARCLMVDPKKRPTVFQLLEEVCKMRGVPYPNIAKAADQSQSVPAAQPPPMPRRFAATEELAAPSVKNAVAKVPSKEHGLQKSYSEKIMAKDPFATLDKTKFVAPSNNKSTSDLVQSFARPGVSGRASKSRPLSMSAASLHKQASAPVSRADLIDGMTREEVLELSPNHHNNINSSVDFIKSATPQRTGDSFKSRFASLKTSNTGHHKRSSISSIKDLLTGGRSRESSRNPSYSSIRSRNPSGSNRSTDSLHEFTTIYRADSNSCSSASETFVEDDQTTPRAEKPSVPAHRPPKRSNSIQRRVHMLLNRKQSPPPAKTAHGYGKYTESDSMPPPAKAKVNKIPIKVITPTRTTNTSPPPFATPSSSATSPYSSLSASSSHRDAGEKLSYQDALLSRVSSVEVSTPSTPLRNRSRTSSKKPPPRPKKPEHLSSNKSTPQKSRPARDSFSDDDVEALERRFYEKFPSAL